MRKENRIANTPTSVKASVDGGNSFVFDLLYIADIIGALLMDMDVGSRYNFHI